VPNRGATTPLIRFRGELVKRCIAALIILIVFASPGLIVLAQEATPVPINLPTSTPVNTEPPLATVTPTRGVPVLVATSTLSGVTVTVRFPPGNVRQAPSLESERIGTIEADEFYQVVSRSGKWLQILYNKNGYEMGWVFEDIVTIQGNATLIPVNGNAPTANVPTAEAARSSTAQVDSIIATPGGFASATSARASATGPFARTATIEPTLGGPRPTFTYPAVFAEATLAPRGAGLVQTGMPPIVPIIALAALGLFGLLISSLRRL
jgi:hypothetical protein